MKVLVMISRQTKFLPRRESRRSSFTRGFKLEKGHPRHQKDEERERWEGQKGGG